MTSAIETVRRSLGPSLAVAAGYFLAAKLGLSVAPEADQVTAVWPPSGIALAAILLLGYRVWPAVFLGAFVANATASEPVPVALGVAIGNTLEPLVGVWLLRRLAGPDSPIDRVRGVLAFGAAAVTSSTVAATIGVTSLSLGGVQPWGAFGSLWTLWWLGDSTGILIVAPFLLAVAAAWRRPAGWRWAETGVLAVSMLVTAVFLFWRSPAAPFAPFSAAYLLFPFVIWAALRLGQPATAVMVVLISTVAIWGTVRGTGPFADPGVASDLGASLRSLQLFMTVVAVTGLLLAAALAERDRVTRSLHEADARKDEFLATLAHELRNPLAPIRNAVAIMDLARTDQAALTTARAIIGRQVHQLVHLVDDLLDLSRITRGRLELRKERVVLATVVEAALETSRPVLDQSGHQLEVALPGHPVTLDGDPIRLTQALANLLTNACRYTPRGGRIGLLAETRGDEVVITVRDNGVGIPPESLARIFEMFTQLDQPTSQPKGGLGIGLTLVRSLVELHGGEVTARSEGLGRGSEFVVRLPTVPSRPSPAVRAGTDAEAAIGSSGPARRILIADDNRDAADSLAAALRLLGNEVEVAYDGVEAVAATAAFRPAIALLDLGMPRLDGYQAARQIRAAPGSRAVVLVALTGWGQDRDRERTTEAGFHLHLVKPVAPADLAELLARIPPQMPSRTT